MGPLIAPPCPHSMGWEIARSGAGVAIGLRDRAAYAPAQILFALAIAARRSAAAGLTDRSTRGFSSSSRTRTRSILDRLHQPTSTVSDRSSSNSTPILPAHDLLRPGRSGAGHGCGATTEHPQLGQTQGRLDRSASEPTGATGRSPGPSLLTVRLRFDRQPFPRPDSANSGFSSSRGATAGTSIKPRPRIEGSTG